MRYRSTGAAASLLALLLGACSDESALCDRLPGVDFRSEEAISAALPLEGEEPELIHEFVEFSTIEVSWAHTDVVETDDYECSDDRVTFLGDRFEADVVEEAGQLVLDRDGIRYLEEQ